MAFVDTLIIGSGFAGSTVAAQLKTGEVLLVDRGEKPNYDAITSRYDTVFSHYYKKRTRSLGESVAYGLEEAYESNLKYNRVVPWSKQCVSEYVWVGDGASNKWYGHAVRISDRIFEDQNSEMSWPFSPQEMEPYYYKAEGLLNLAGDKKKGDVFNLQAYIQGTEYWHKLLAPYFQGNYFISVAKNNSELVVNEQGRCCGAGSCMICPVDAKARPENIFQDRPIRYETKVDEIIFEGDKAVRVKCTTSDGSEEEISFNRLVIAAHAMESCNILLSSRLPSGVKKEYIGKFYHDHALYDVTVRMKEPVKFGYLGTGSHLYIPELSQVIDGLEVMAIMNTTPPPDPNLEQAMKLELLNKQDIKGFFDDLGTLANFNFFFEMPTDAGIYAYRSLTGRMKLQDKSYKKLVGRYNAIVDKIEHLLKEKGLEVVTSWRHYENYYGDNHPAGILNMSQGSEAVVDKEFRVIGTENVHVAGSALFPRMGAANPTLSIMALAIKLGEKLEETA